jgi:hypothetical protein
MKYWIYYIIGIALLFHPHLAQKIEMLIAYFSHEDYELWTTFSMMDFFDLILHAGLPLLFIILGLKKQLALKHD